MKPVGSLAKVVLNLSRPSRARELKHYAEKGLAARLLSRPSRARELKLEKELSEEEFNSRAPRGRVS